MKPAARPCANVRDTRYSTLGPGVATSAITASTNSNQVASGITRRLDDFDADGRRFAAADAQRRDAALLVLRTQRTQ
jgi:hypothetical protein